MTVEDEIIDLSLIAAANTFIREAADLPLPDTYRSAAVRHQYHHAHPHIRAMRAQGFKITDADEREIRNCPHCLAANSTAQPHTYVFQVTANRPLHKVWNDTHGPEQDIYGDPIYVVGIMDYYSRNWQ